MNTPIVLTIIGEDRPGLVDSISEIVAERGGNWLASRMAHLGGHFAGILRLEVPEESKEALVAALRELESRGVTVVVRADAEAPAAAPSRAARLDVVGHDRPGIIRHLSRSLASHGVNVEELTTECYSAPMSGEMLFRANALLLLPKGCDLKALRKDLESLAGELMVDISLEESMEDLAEAS